jgi:hypothetical protein
MTEASAGDPHDFGVKVMADLPLTVEEWHVPKILTVKLKSRLKAYSMASVTVPRRWSASKIATPSGPHTTASPSSVNDLAHRAG